MIIVPRGVAWEVTVAGALVFTVEMSWEEGPMGRDVHDMLVVTIGVLKLEVLLDKE